MLSGLVEYSSETESVGSAPSSPKAISAKEPNDVSSAAPSRNGRQPDQFGSSHIKPVSALPYISAFPDFPTNVEPDEKTVSSIKYYADAMKLHNFDLVSHIRGYRDFGNPYILTNVVDHFQIDQYGSNYPKEMFDPKGYPEADYHESLFRGNLPSVPSVANMPVDQPMAIQSVPESSFQPPQPAPQQSFQQQQQQQPSQSRYQSWSSTAAAVSSTATFTTESGPNTHKVNRTSSYNQSLSDITAYATALSVGKAVVYGERTTEELAAESRISTDLRAGSNSSSAKYVADGSDVVGSKRKSRWDSTDQS